MEIRYEWRVLSDDGLLKEPRKTSDEENVNYFSGNDWKWYNDYKTEQEANEALEQWYKECDEWDNFGELLTLVKTVRKD